MRMGDRTILDRVIDLEQSTKDMDASVKMLFRIVGEIERGLKSGEKVAKRPPGPKPGRKNIPLRKPRRPVVSGKSKEGKMDG